MRIPSFGLMFAVAASGSLYAEDVAPKKKDQPLPAAQKLEPYECGKVARLHAFNGIFLASQPEPDDFKLAKEGGIKTVINLREKDELNWDEEGLVKKLEMKYLSLPFKAPASLSDKVFDQAREVLNDKDQRPILLHCASANRVGAIWLAHRVLDGKLSYDEAFKEAETVGLKLPAYVEKAKEYIQRQQK